MTSHLGGSASGPCRCPSSPSPDLLLVGNAHSPPVLHKATLYANFTNSLPWLTLDERVISYSWQLGRIFFSLSKKLCATFCDLAITFQRPLYTIPLYHGVEAGACPESVPFKGTARPPGKQGSVSMDGLKIQLEQQKKAKQSSTWGRSEENAHRSTCCIPLQSFILILVFVG